MSRSTLLDTLTNNFPPVHLKNQRTEIAKKYHEDGDFKKSARIQKCGEPTVMVCTHCGEKTIFSYRCGLRTCQSCAAARSRQLVVQYRKIMNSTIEPKQGWRTKLITFTVPTNGDFEGAIARINKAMVSIWETFLRRDSMGRKIKTKKKGVRVASGMIAALEMGPKTGNVHVHCLYYGPYIPRGNVYMRPNGSRCEAGRKGGLTEDQLKGEKAEMIEKGLVERWKDETGAFIVDVRPADKDALREVVKYITKPAGVSPAHFVEFERVMKGNRRFKTYGVFFNPAFEARQDDADMKGKECPGCEQRGTLIFEENLEAYLHRLFFGKNDT